MQVGQATIAQLLGASVLGDGLGTLRHGVLGQLSRKKETNRSLDLTGGDGRPLVVVGQLASLSGDPFKEIVDEGVHDGHRLGRDSSVWVDLLQYLVNVDGIRLLRLALPLLLVALGDRLGSFATLGCGLARSLGRHSRVGLKSATLKKCYQAV